MGTTADKLNKVLESKAAIKAAIEEKGVTGVGDVLSTYPDKIRSIQAGGNVNLQEKSVELNEDYLFDVTPDEGYDGMGKVSVNVNTPAVKMFDSLFELPSDFPDIYKVVSDPRYVRPEYKGRIIVCGGAEYLASFNIGFQIGASAIPKCSAIQACDGVFYDNVTEDQRITVDRSAPCFSKKKYGWWYIFYFNESTTKDVFINLILNNAIYVIIDNIGVHVDIGFNGAIPTLDYMNGGGISTLTLPSSPMGVRQGETCANFRFLNNAVIDGVGAPFYLRENGYHNNKLIIKNFPYGYAYHNIFMLGLDYSGYNYLYVDLNGLENFYIPSAAAIRNATKLRFGKLPIKAFSSINLSSHTLLDKESYLSLINALPPLQTAKTITIPSSIYDALSAEEKKLFSDKNWTLASL